VIELVAFLVFMVLLLGAGAIWGWVLTGWLFEHRRKTLDDREAKLQHEWHALHAAQRLNATFMQARKAMWEEAVRQHHRRPDTR
jgi:hypothetical protein